jgi:hypothetical protein
VNFLVLHGQLLLLLILFIDLVEHFIEDAVGVRPLIKLHRQPLLNSCGLRGIKKKQHGDKRSDGVSIPLHFNFVEWNYNNKS